MSEVEERSQVGGEVGENYGLHLPSEMSFLIVVEVDAIYLF